MLLENQDYFEFKLKDKNFFNLLLSSLASNKRNYTIELIEVKKDSAVTLCTLNKKEVLIIISGRGGVTIGGKSTMLEFGDVIYTPSNSVRSLANISNEIFHAISIQYITNP